jgi:hypothetical protein
MTINRHKRVPSFGGVRNVHWVARYRMAALDECQGWQNRLHSAQTKVMESNIS